MEKQSEKKLQNFAKHGLAETTSASGFLNSARSRFLAAILVTTTACDVENLTQSQVTIKEEPTVADLVESKVFVEPKAPDTPVEPAPRKIISPAGTPPAIKPGTEVPETAAAPRPKPAKSPKSRVQPLAAEDEPKGDPKTESKPEPKGKPAKERFMALADKMKERYESGKIDSPECEMIRTSGVSADWPVDELTGSVKAGSQVRFFALLTSSPKKTDEFTVTLDYSDPRYKDSVTTLSESGSAIPINQIYSLPADLHGNQTVRVTWMKGKKPISLCSTTFQVD